MLGHQVDMTNERRWRHIRPPKDVYDDIPEEDVDVFEEHRRKTIADRETEYQARRHNRTLSPERSDPFAAASKSTEQPAKKRRWMCLLHLLLLQLPMVRLRRLMPPHLRLPGTRILRMRVP